MKNLLATLETKERYVAHYTVIQQAVRLGMRISKVHRAISFFQSYWMKQFIDINADLRKRATDEFSKGFYKLILNSACGKTMEQVRKRVVIRLVTTESALAKLIRQARFVDHTIISDSVTAVHLRKSVFS